MSSFLQQLLALAPSGESPYAFAADEVSHVLPRKPRWFFWMLAAGSVVGAINLVMNFVCIYMIGTRRKLGGTSPYWLVRLRYDHSSGVPYLVPNALMMFLLFNGIFALLMQPYIWINYVAYMHPTRNIVPNTGLYFWYGFMFIFDGSGMWISAFGTFYATLLPQLLVRRNAGNFKLVVHPTFLNALCYGLPAMLFVTQVVTSALSQTAWSDMMVLRFDIMDRLGILNNQWVASNGTSADQNMLDDTLKLAEPFLSKVVASREAFSRNALTCGAWYLLCLLFFIPSAVWLLHTLQRTIARKLQFVTRMPDSGGEMQFQVALRELPPTELLVRSCGEHEEHWHKKLGQSGALHRPPSLVAEGHEPDSGQTTPTSAVFLAPEHQHEVLSPVVAAGAEGRGDLGGVGPVVDSNPQSHAHHPHDPGGHWEVNATSTTKKLQTTYYSAMLQFGVTGFCLGTAAGSWIWAAMDPRVMLDSTLHALAVLLSVWLYSVVGTAVNVFICIRLKAIGFHLPKSKLMGFLSGVWTSNLSRDRQTTVHV